MAFDRDIVASHDKGGRLVLISNSQRVVEPVLDVRAPLGLQSVTIPLPEVAPGEILTSNVP